MRISRPSTGTILGAVALFVALGGTAVAATGQIVNIADPTTAANVAKVDSSGALKTAGTASVTGVVGETSPKTPFFGGLGLSATTQVMPIGANKATVALTRLDFDNAFNQPNAARIEVDLFELSGTTTTCDGSSGESFIGSYDVPAGQTFADAMQSPIVLKPLATGEVWCLLAQTFIEGNPSFYVAPVFSFSGYVVSGTLPTGALPARVPTGARIHRVTR
jgi:hypothetical protein